jgi:O-antigen/teichoic acid export membrane protein
MLAKLAKNSAALIGAGLIDKAANVLLFAYLVRRLSTSEFGAYSLILTIFVFGGMLANFGLDYVLIREVAKDKSRAQEILNNTISITIVFSLAAWPMMIGMCAGLNYAPEVIRLVAAGGIIFLFMGIGAMANATLKAFERMEIFALISMSYSFILLLLSALALAVGVSLGYLILILVVLEGLRAIVSLVIVHRFFVPLRLSINRASIIGILKQSVSFALLMMLAVILHRLDTLLLGWLKPLEAVAMYSAAVKFFDFLSLFSNSMITALYPTFSAKLASSSENAWDLYDKSLGIFAFLGFASAYGIMALAPSILGFLFGSGYMQAATALRWMGWAFLFNVISGPVGTLLLAAGNQMKNLLIMSTCVIVCNFLLNIWLIPIWDYNGTAIAFFISSILGFGGRLILSKKHFGKLPSLWRAFRGPMIAGALMWIVLTLLDGRNLFVLIALGATVNMGVLAVMGKFRQLSSSLFRGSKLQAIFKTFPGAD